MNYIDEYGGEQRPSNGEVVFWAILVGGYLALLGILKIINLF